MQQWIMRLSMPFIRWRREEETMPWSRNGRRQVKFFNASVSGRRQEWATPVSEGKRSTQDSSCFPCGVVTDGYNDMTMCGGG
jgi:hypothetical protein